MPSALAFLEFLRDRGSSTLLQAVPDRRPLDLDDPDDLSEDHPLADEPPAASVR